MSEKNGKIAIVPGSFDPMTLGHRTLIEEVCKRYEVVYVAVMTNFAKKPFLESDMRRRIAELTVSDLSNAKVVADDGLLVDLFDRLHADVVCKGYRNEADLAYERVQDEWNRAHNPRFLTELIPAAPGTGEISSTLVRERLAKGEDLSGLVDPRVIPLLREKPTENKIK